MKPTPALRQAQGHPSLEGSRTIPSREGCRVSGGVGCLVRGRVYREPTPAFGHPSLEGSRTIPSREGCRVSGGVGCPRPGSVYGNPPRPCGPPLRGGDEKGEAMKRKIVSYNPRLKERARHLRQRMTRAEVLLWQHLKARQIEGYDFDRQRPIDEYIVDFFSKDLMLAIEVDGVTHDSATGQQHDRRRQQRLEALGVRFLRFQDEEVTQNLEGVLTVIREWVREHAPTSDKGSSAREGRSGGTHPGLRPPLQGGDRKNSPPWRERGNVSSNTHVMLDTFPLCAAPAVGWVPVCILPLLLAIAVTCTGCAVVPLSLYQTLPSTGMALASLEGTQRSLDDTGAEYENSLETAPAERPVAAYGATHGAYQRWVTDEVRELPDVSQTIAIGGGDT